MHPRVGRAWALTLALFLGATLDAEPLLHTYSIVARDPETGELGGAVHSHWVAVGALCLWAEPGVGVVVTQAKTRPSYGPQGLARLAAGEAPREVLAALQDADPEAPARQVAILDVRGRVAAVTGTRTIPVASHITGDGFSVQANLMSNDRVVPAMARGFRRASGPLGHRLLAALEAAEAAGGDARGQQAAAVVVVAGEPTGNLYADRRLDLRVDDHPQAVAELRRIYEKRRAIDAWQAADAALRAGRVAEAALRFQRAAEALPESLEIRFWHALTQAQEGHLQQARRGMAQVLQRGPAWRGVLESLPGTSVLPDRAAGERLVAELLSAPPGR